MDYGVPDGMDAPVDQTLVDAVYDTVEGGALDGAADITGAFGTEEGDFYGAADGGAADGGAADGEIMTGDDGGAAIAESGDEFVVDDFAAAAEENEYLPLGEGEGEDFEDDDEDEDDYEDDYEDDDEMELLTNPSSKPKQPKQPPRRKKKWLWWLLALAVVVAGLLAVWWFILRKRTPAAANNSAAGDNFDVNAAMNFINNNAASS